MVFKKRIFKKKKPFRKWRKKGAKIRKARYYNNNGNMVVKQNKNTGPLPMRWKANLVYAEGGIYNDPGLGTFGTYVFSMNSLYDPNVTSTGHQPLGFDNVMKFYKYYTVIGAKAVITFQNTDTAYSQYVGAFLHQTSTPTLTLSEIQENGLGSYGVLQPLVAGSDASSCTITVPFSARQWFGTKQIVGDTLYSGDVSSSPTDNCYLVTWCTGRNGVDSQKVLVDVRIEYITVFSNPEYLLTS